MINVRGPYSKVSFERMNLGSPDQVKQFLYTEGWIPTQWNYILDAMGKKQKSSPKITDDSFGSIQGDLGKQYLLWNSLMHKRSFLKNKDKPEEKGLLSKIRSDGRVAANAITLGTPTSRYRHKDVTNVPSVDTEYGYEIRATFEAEYPYIFIGCDLKGIEARLMAHLAILFGDPEFAKIILNHDIHQYTADKMGITRSEAKTLRYALSYGAGVGKIMADFGVKRNRAQEIIDDFWNAQPGLKKALKYLQAALKARGYIIGLDGRKVKLRASHTLLNYYIQSAAAIIFKKWMILFDDARKSCWIKDTIHQVIAMHDEMQYELTEPTHYNKVQTLLLETAIQAGEHYKILIPIECDVKVGFHWGDTH